jgi:ribosomal small subunit protein bTHX
MGKGNAKSFIGKLFRGSYGKYRPRKRKKRKFQTIIKYDVTTEFHNLLNLNKGDILWACDKHIKNHPHPMVFLEERDEDNFAACSLSTKAVNGNIKMKPEHFCDKDEHGKSYNFLRNKNTPYLIAKRYEKKNDWVFEKKPVGRLTEEGVRFVERNIPSEATYHPKPVWKQ